MAEQNPFIGKTPEELQALTDQIEQAKDAANGKKDVAAAIAFRLSYEWLKSRDKLGAAIPEISAKAYPRPNQIGSKAGFSETEIHKISEEVRKMLG